jgi:uncharacterized protein YecE (DUF72 family)
MLHFYARHFNTVEINNTFYRMPKAPMLREWAGEFPAAFRFVLKASQRITHIQRLMDVGDSVSYLLKVSGVLEKRLGALLFQLPPNMKKDLPRLREFLSLLPAQGRAALEFRHTSWFDEEVFGLLHDHHVALCIAEAENDLEVPFAATTNWGYLRLHRPGYNDAQLKTWVKWVQKQQWRTAFVFFKHEDVGAGPQLAQRFLALAR